MGGKYDFYVQWQENQKKLAIDQLENAWLERNRCGKNTLVCHTGDSSEGKSTATIQAIDNILSEKGIDLVNYISDVTVYTPFQYPSKIKKILYDPAFKEIPFLILDDARFVVNAKRWYDFINQAIIDITSISRRQKAITMIINTPYLTDVDKDLRRTLTFWGECYRPLHHPVQVKYMRFYHDTRDPENIKIKKRKFRGIIVKDGRRHSAEPTYYTFLKPRPELWHKYDEESHAAKNKLLEGRINMLLDNMKKELGINDRVEQLLEYYSAPGKYSELLFHLRKDNKKIKIRPDSLPVLGLSKGDGEEFLLKLEARLKTNLVPEAVQNVQEEG